MAPGMLGADVVREGNAWKISRIFHGDPADELEPPLLAPAAAVKEGEYILAVNHRAPVAGEPLEALLAGTAGQRVVLTVNGRASMDGAREAVVSPIGDDSQLRYADWVRRNREYVTEKSGGKLGYIHIPDMGGPGLVAFDTWFYPQLDREGMVIDCRWNRGGFVSQLILERLRRSVVSFDRSRGGGVYTYPARVLNGPFVVLTNEFAGSDGDIFPASVQATGIAPVIGKRSWGGVIGIRGDKPLVDGTWLTQPEYAFWWPKGGWVIENHGVDPDIEVDNRPQDVAAGVDPQLDRGIVEAMKLRESRPPLEPAFGPEPVKTRESFEAKEK
jgi:tricorn protease